MVTSDANIPLAAVRSGIRRSADPRAVRTRERIASAVQRLSHGGREVTVRAIVAEAAVSRATFYTHFADLEELALWLQSSTFEVLAEAERSEADAGDPAEAMLVSQQRLVEHYAQNRALYAAVFTIPVARGMQSAVAQTMARRIRDHIVDRADLPAALDAHLSALYIANAATGVIVAWVLDEVEADADAIASHLFELMPRWMHRDRHSHDGPSVAREPERIQP
ncbi:TetR/AcrR family transcriptional regulator [Agromyces laixinhei]|uniref:TetR/AcrR family transcriptional regulator n=1 Tax=Agromyces laixinhei TaxID=2585717 RepID=UPI001116DED8|nr:TetR/AcrR family transcriptional regulator [Agromyces laixinhei]